jgi:predicted DNA-binding transcriptional regulator AlpA
VPRNAPQHKTPAPPGHVWIDGASRLSGRTIETLYKDRSIQRRTGQCPGPRSVDLGRKAAWRIADIDAWLAGAPELGPDQSQLHNSRPAEPARAAA